MTPARFQRLRAVLDRRQPDLTVLLDNVHKPHNLSAILRSCDAVGVFEAHAVWRGARFRARHLTSGGTGRWVTVRTHPNLPSAVDRLHREGLPIVVAHPEASSVDFRELDYTRPTAVLLGAELDGVSAPSLALADQRARIPMQGMGQALNVSVAAALLLFEAERQRTAAGLYDSARLNPVLYRKTLFEWAHPRVAACCRRHGTPFPDLDEEGLVLAPPGWDPSGSAARRRAGDEEPSQA